MKKLLILALALALFTCNEEPKIDYALFSGKIENPTDKVVTVFNGREKVKEMALDKDGTFTDTLKIETGFYSFSHGRESSALYLSPGDNINVTLNTKEFDETITYTGEGSQNNNYLAAKYMADEKAFIDASKLYSSEESEFIAITNEIKSSKLELLKSATQIDPDFKTLEEKNIKYDHLNYLQNYASAHRYYAKKEDFKASEELMNILEEVDYTNEKDYETIDNYKYLVQGFYSKKIRESDSPADVFAMINKDAFPALKKDLANNLNYDIAPNNENNEAYYNGIMAISNDAKFKENLTKKYNKVKTLVKGMPSPKFVNYENHKGGTTSLDDLKGKYVYIDVWATWCGPCIAEIPSLQKVEKQYHGKNIAFISTSIDQAKDHNTWVEMVKEKQLGGMQLMADNAWSSQFVQDYAIQGIPRFILVDPNGNIVSADAPRPSSPKLLELFEELSI